MRRLRMKAFLRAAIPMAIFMSIVFIVLGMIKNHSGIVEALPLGLVVGVLLGIIFGVIFVHRYDAQSEAIEPIREQIAAEHEIALDAMAYLEVEKSDFLGYLFLCEDGMRWVPSPKGTGGEELFIPASDYKGIAKTKDKTGIEVKYADTSAFFRIEFRDQWITKYMELTGEVTYEDTEE